MIRILLALVIITVLLYMNPLNKFNKSHLNEKNQTSVEQRVDEVQKQVDEAKRIQQQSLDNVESSYNN